MARAVPCCFFYEIIWPLCSLFTPCCSYGISRSKARCHPHYAWICNHGQFLCNGKIHGTRRYTDKQYRHHHHPSQCILPNLLAICRPHRRVDLTHKCGSSFLDEVHCTAASAHRPRHFAGILYFPYMQSLASSISMCFF